MTGRGRTWRYPAPVVENLLALTGLATGAVLVAWFVIAFLIDRFGTLDSSVWDPISGIAVWYAAFIGGYAMYEVLPKFVANGRTRRDSAIEMGIFGAIHTVAVSVAITLGFVIERAVFSLLDWRQGVPEDRIFDSFTDYPLIFVASLISVAAGTAAGALIGIGFYRDNWRGILAVLLVMALGSFQSGSTGLMWGPFGWMAASLDIVWGTAMTVTIALIGVAVSIAVAWVFTRDVPLHNK